MHQLSSRFRTLAVCALVATSLAGGVIACGDTTESTGRSEGELRNDAWSAGLREGSPDAIAIVNLANDRRMTAERYVREVGIGIAFAEAIVDTRNGADLQAHTYDDEEFAYLSELDALPGSDVDAFLALRDYVRYSYDAGADGGHEAGDDSGLEQDSGSDCWYETADGGWENWCWWVETDAGSDATGGGDASAD